MNTITIARRFNGPPDSGNGGYVCGAFAVAAGLDARVRLLSPPPLEVPLELAQGPAGEWTLSADATPVARAVPNRLELEVPAPPRYTQAVWASQHYPGFHQHAFPDCFVCGPHRRRGDGKVGVEYHWAALDCPGYFAVSAGRRFMLLGEMQAHVDRRVRVGEPCTVIGWKVGADGRKHQAGTAVFDGEGELCARALATWVERK